MTLPVDFTHTEIQSVIEDLQVALDNYSSILKETSSTLASRLSQYQSCAEQLGSVCPDALCRVFTLNQDLLQHLGSYQSSAECASSSSSSSSSTNFNSLRKSIQCLQCWSQQVAALSQ
ncbi:hypothetical protein INR49_006442 [Scomber scombrus]|uniref:Uncharacterized protein n=1 Tax=Scomber scombrus TaxID=13677 RepID=A0AAV1QHS0_SCOSC